MKGVLDLNFLDFLIQNPCDWENFFGIFSKKLELDATALIIFHNESLKFKIFLNYGLNEKFFQNFEKIIKNNPTFSSFIKSIPERKILDEDEEEETIGARQELKEFMKRIALENGFSHMLISGILNRQNENLILIAFRKKDKAYFGKNERDLIGMVSPYIKMVYQYCITIEEKEKYLDILKRAIEFEGKGIILIDKNLNVLFLNRIAEIILSKKEGLEITKYGLEINDPVFSIHFKKSLKKIFNSEYNDKEDIIFAIPKRDRTIPLVVQVIPINERFFLKEGQGSALIILYDSSYYPLPDPEFLTKLFKFTSQEKNIAILLTKGMDLKEISKELKISLHTVRTHLKHIYSKTNTARQAELMKLLLSLPAGF